jgi:RNA-directed DNA polymerase
VLAKGSVHEALDRWVEQVVTPHGRGEALISRDADDCGGAFRDRSEAEWVDEALPKRRGKFTREVAQEQTRIRRCRRVHPGLMRRCTLLGVACFWTADRQGGQRVNRRTVRQTWPRACTRSKAWMQANRHVPGNAFCTGLQARRRGHDRDDGFQGNSHALARVWATTGACTWRNRRGGKRRSFSWARVTQILDAVPRERSRLTEVRRRSGLA